jgi:FixJ family two-component response regulator
MGRAAPQVADHPRLTEAEEQVRHYAAMGHGNKLIAYELGITEAAVHDAHAPGGAAAQGPIPCGSHPPLRGAHC